MVSKPDEDLWANLGIPPGFKRPPKAKSESVMKAPEKVFASDDATAAAAEDQAKDTAQIKHEAKANGAAKPSKVKAKATAKASGKAKAAPKAAPKKAAAKKASAKKERKQPVRDPAKLDDFGFRKGSIKSRAAALYAAKKGATLKEVKEAVGSVQFNLLTELEEKGFTIDRKTEGKEGTRQATRYFLKAKK